MTEKQNLFNIKIFDNGEVFVESRVNNAILTKTTTLQYFLSTFGQSFSSVETPIIPVNCRKIIKSSNSELYIFEYAAHSRTIHYNDGRNVCIRSMEKSLIYLKNELIKIDNYNLFKYLLRI